MLNIRLQRTGKKGQAYFRVIVAEHTKKPKGSFLELLGSYDPHRKELKVNKERVEYWLSKGAKITPTVNNLMVNFKQWDRPKMQSWKAKKSDKPNTAEAAVPEPTPKPKEEPKQEETKEAPVPEAN
ncbi:MAG: 30S ribosomal protein S16 [Candidatus Yanofskybacteria bacterium RIFCSPHIGHO2_02_FULL_41_11]|uniref:Small ribosomal subunit protein bS16 n=1 Tax=Candidatus Yanofskybacteria bacterium RIFCSPHIGHO2_02_FULL_41_11 TaxID=1802675 RepID=A0A1F8FC42_9BACT|nr:MAG: 30S ribosomal protein S16 [Candidatus Yanofskybacteria bacterium RIFCSPHIGHO2_02_FULL_41_11]